MTDSDFATALLEGAPDALVVLDSSGVVVFANARAEVLLVYPRVVLRGRPFEQVVSVPGHERFDTLAVRRSRRATDGNGPPAIELEARRGDGSTLPVELTLAPIDLAGARFTMVSLRDVSERRALEASLRYRSLHDALTGLENRGAFDEALLRFAEKGPLPIGVLMVDLDGLKSVNDHFGHAAGDELLQRAARTLRESFRAEDVVARIGGDEFAVLAPGKDAGALAHMAERLEERLAQQHHPTLPVPLRVSIGFSVAEEATALSAAVRDADAKMYLTKRAHHA